MYQDDKRTRVDSAAVTDGVFVFKGNTDNPRQATVFLNSKGNNFMLYDAGFLNITSKKGI